MKISQNLKFTHSNGANFKTDQNFNSCKILHFHGTKTKSSCFKFKISTKSAILMEHITKMTPENQSQKFPTYSEHKSVVAERFNKTLKEMMWKKFTAENTNSLIP